MHADDQPDLLVERRRADDVAGLEILRRVAGVRRGDADDRADAERDGRVDVARPAQRHEQQAGQDQRGDRHARDRIGRRADETGDARRDRREEEPEDERSAPRRGRCPGVGRPGVDGQEDRQQQRAAEHDGHRNVALGARAASRRPTPAERSFRLPRADDDDRRDRARQRDQARQPARRPRRCSGCRRSRAVLELISEIRKAGRLPDCSRSSDESAGTAR